MEGGPLKTLFPDNQNIHTICVVKMEGTNMQTLSMRNVCLCMRVQVTIFKVMYVPSLIVFPLEINP
jgi:hypothetical protein